MHLLCHWLCEVLVFRMLMSPMLVQQANPKGYNNSTRIKARAAILLSPFIILFLLEPTIQILIISPLTSNTISKHKEIFT